MDINLETFAGSAAETIAPISRQIWDAKYRLKSIDGTPIDLTIEDTWRRVARALAGAETDPSAWEPIFQPSLDNSQFSPASQFVSGADLRLVK